VPPAGFDPAHPLPEGGLYARATRAINSLNIKGYQLRIYTNNL